MTMGGSWAYNPQETNWKAPQQLVQNLVNVVSGGGNYLLNIGPTPRGTFPPEAVERLKHIGRWMNTYHESIYGATYTPLRDQSWGQATRNGDKVYLHIFHWPLDGELVIAAFPGKVQKANLFAGEALAFHQEGERLEITLPADAPDPDVSVLAIEIDPAEKGWSAYNAPIPATIEPKKYIQDQAIASFIVNVVLNGAIAFCAYSFFRHFSYYEVAKDILITVFIIAFLTSWIMVGSARNEYVKGNLARHPTKRRGLKLPTTPLWRGLLIGFACAVVFGGLVSALVYLFSSSGMSNWAYAFYKTIYAGLSGALASALTIWSVASDENRK